MKINYKDFKEKIENYLTFPGNGVFTVHTAKNLKESITQKLYKTKNFDHAQEAWRESLNHFPLSSKVTLLGIPSDTGGGILRGANWGPCFLRETILQSKEELNYFDIGDVRVNPHLLHDKYLNTETINQCREAMYEGRILPVSPLSIAEDFASSLYLYFPHKKIFAIGGDHSVSYPLVKSYMEDRVKRGVKFAIIHFDAHTDLLERRQGIDINFGTWANQILRYLEDPSCFIQLGIRSSGQTKEHWESKFGIKQYWADEIEGKDLHALSKALIQHLKNRDIQELYISFDIDCLSSEYASATGTPEANGLSPHSPMYILQELYEHFAFGGADLTEIAPMTASNNSAQSAVEPQTTLMVASSFSTFLIQALGHDFKHGHH
jgi:agmatinase